MDTSHPARERLLKLPEVLQLTGLSKSTLYRKIASHTFPPQVEQGPKGVAWHEWEVLAWIASRPIKRKMDRK